MTIWRNHRTMGYEVARATAPDGAELIILQTAQTRQEVAPRHMLIPATAADLIFETEIALCAAVDRARFLGVDLDDVRAAFDRALESA